MDSRARHGVHDFMIVWQSKSIRLVTIGKILETSTSESGRRPNSASAASNFYLLNAADSQILHLQRPEFNCEMMKVLGTVPHDTYSTIINEFKLPVSLESLRAEMEVECDKNMLKARLMPGAERLITHLKKHDIPIAIATSSSERGFLTKTKNDEVQKLLAH